MMNSINIVRKDYVFTKVKVKAMQ